MPKKLKRFKLFDYYKAFIPLAITFLIIFTQLYFLYRTVPSEAQTPPQGCNKIIVILGSSTAAGHGVANRDSSWVNRLKRFIREKTNAGYSVVNLAQGGYTTYKILPTNSPIPRKRPYPDSKRNVTAALRLKPAYIIINMPSNDAASRFTVEEQINNWLIIRNTIRKAGVPLWVTTTQPRKMSRVQKENLKEVKDAILLLFEQRTIDIYTPLAAENGAMKNVFDAGDGIHLNEYGHFVIFNMMSNLEFIKSLNTEKNHEKNTNL